MRKPSGINFLTMMIVPLMFSCSGYIAEKYKIIYGTRCIYHGSRIQMLIEDIDAIHDLVVETSQSFDLRKISIDEVREKYFWLDHNADIMFAYCNSIGDEFYNLIILYEVKSQKRIHNMIIPQFTYWIEFFSYSKYGTETEELITLRDEFIRNFEARFGAGSILTEEQATPPPPPIYVPKIIVGDSLPIISSDPKERI